MTPRLTRQPKVLIETQNNSETNQVSRLAVSCDIPITVSIINNNQTYYYLYISKIHNCAFSKKNI